MLPRYLEAIESASEQLTTALLDELEELLEQGPALDRTVQTLLHEVGHQVLEQTYAGVEAYLVEQYQSQGWHIERHPTVVFKTLYGEIEVASPYLQRPGEPGGVRPMRLVMGVEGTRYSEAVERALVDFGIEKSFQRAATQFQEHYGWPISDGAVLRRTESVAQEAQEYIHQRLQHPQGDEVPQQELSPQTYVIELDGCDIRTGVFMTAAAAGLEERDPYKRVRIINWKEVRTGIVRRLNQTSKQYVCVGAPYSQVCDQLFAVATEQGLRPKFLVLAPGDGAPGLSEEMARHFENLQFILDPSHLKSHFFETAEALGIAKKLRRQWVNTYMERLWANDGTGVLNDLKGLFETTENDRLRCLINHLNRFAHCVDYGKFKANGWPVGSGEVESAHRYVPQERLKIAGACWHPDRVNPMLALRVVRANGWWHEFWQWISTQRQQKRAA